MEEKEALNTRQRIISLDQFRGFAIFGMILVNYLGYFDKIPDTYNHRNCIIWTRSCVQHMGCSCRYRFRRIADIKKIEIPHLTLLGMNPLILYILQNILIELHGEYLNRNSAIWIALCGFAVIYLICFAVAHYMHRNKLVLKI